MIKIKGVNFYPSQIEEIIEKFPEILGEYQIKLDRIDNIDSIQLCVELKENSCVERIEKNIAEKIKSSIGINLTVKGKKMGDLPRNQGKTKRIIDDRKV
jgi:phenylacetate-CoA ligase